MSDQPTPKDWTQAFFAGAWLGHQLQGREAEKNTREADFIEGVLALPPGAKVLDERRFDPATGRMESVWTWIKDGKEESYDLSLRVYTFRELADVLRAAGFREITGYETLTGKPLDVGSSRCTAVAVKQARDSCSLCGSQG